jgi:hypothetical protein
MSLSDNARDNQHSPSGNDLRPVVDAISDALCRLSGTNLPEVLSDLDDREYRAIVPILLYWLPRVTSFDAKEWIAGSLCDVRAGPEACSVLLRELYVTDFRSRLEIVRAIEFTADASLISELAELARQTADEMVRRPIVRALGRTLDPAAIEILSCCLDDDGTASAAVVALGQYPPQLIAELRPRFEALMSHPRPYIRVLAQRLVDRLDRAAGRPLPMWPPEERGLQALDAFASVIRSSRFNSVIDGPQPPWLVAEAEAVLDVSFPPTYRQFLRQLGQVALFGDVMYGIPGERTMFWTDVVEMNSFQRRSRGLLPHLVVFWLEEHTYPAYLVIDTSLRDAAGESPIRRWYGIDSPPEAELDIVAPDFGAAALMIAQQLLADVLEADEE